MSAEYSVFENKSKIGTLLFYFCQTKKEKFMAKDMKVKDYVAQMQSGRSFVKAKMDSAGIGKVHLSFVEHSGRPKCEHNKKSKIKLQQQELTENKVR